MEEKLKITVKKSDGKAFKASDDNWYNLNAPAIPQLAGFNKGDEVVVTFEKKGTSRYVSNLASATATVAAPAQTATETGFKCNVCGKALKDGKYQTCFTCNKQGKTAAPATTAYPSAAKSTNTYNDPAKTAQIQRGNALNAAAAAASSCAFSDPSAAAQFVRELADSLLDWLRLE